MTDATKTDWSFLRRFNASTVSQLRSRTAFDDWTAAAEFALAGRRLATELASPVTENAREWNTRLLALGGEPSATDWARFRPLRLEREEAWSDWLAHLLETSPAFCSSLLSSRVPPMPPGAAPVATREDTVEHRRADVVLRWNSGTRIHIEVKVGDEAFEKTFETSALLQSREAGDWHHVILLPPWSLAHWSECVEASRHPLARKVDAMTWRELALKIRQELWRAAAPLSWSAWAWAFTGAVEQRLLGCPRLASATLAPAADGLALSGLAALESLLEEGKRHE